MTRTPSFGRTFSVGLRIELDRIKQHPATWLLTFILLAVGVVLGFVETSGWEPIFGPLKLSMSLTIISSFWGYHATTCSNSRRMRELVVARAADEMALHMARITLTGLYGGAVTVLFFLATALPRSYSLAAWQFGLRWTPHIFLAHLMSASMGGMAALAALRWPQLGMILTGGLWYGSVIVASRFGPSSPDLLLRVLRWNHLLKDASSDPIYVPLMLSFAVVTFLGVSFGVTLLAIGEQRSMPVPRPMTLRLVTWCLAAMVTAVGLVTSLQDWRGREDLLLAGARASTSTQILTLEWDPSHSELKVIDGEVPHEALRGPARPTTVAPSEFQAFAPYIGRNGVVLPVSRLRASGSYEFVIRHPASWRVYGCSYRANEDFNTVRCWGEAAERDWLVLLPDYAIEEAMRTGLRTSSSENHAQGLFLEGLSLAFAVLHVDMPQVLPYLSAGGPRWLGKNTLAGSMITGGDQGIMIRNAAYYLAMSIAMYLVDTRSPEEDLLDRSSGLGDEQWDSMVPLALIGTIDRLVFELGPFKLDPLEVCRRSGQQVSFGALRYRMMPQLKWAEFNQWWLTTDSLISEKGVRPEEIWRVLSQVGRDMDARDWPATMRRLWDLGP